MNDIAFSPRFVELIPQRVEERVIYISMEYATAIHRCPCGCGGEVVTAFSPTDWSLEFDGESISLDPSIGNWNFPCRSHYYIKRGKVRWAASMSPEAIARGRSLDRESKRKYYAAAKETLPAGQPSEPLPPAAVPVPAARNAGFWESVKAWLYSLTH